MKARELKEWAERAPPGTMVPAERIAEMLAEIEDPEPKRNGSSVFLTPETYAAQVLGGARSGKTVARWCKERKIPPTHCRQLPHGDWLVRADAQPPTAGSATPPRPAGRDGDVSLRQLVRRSGGRPR